jgi:hypothetical protein
MPLIGVEAGAAAVAAWLASAIIAAYLADRLGFTIAPLPVLLASLAPAAGVWLTLRRRTDRDRASLAACVTVVAATFAWLMWRARPDFLPMGSGSDLAHHLSLLRYLEEHRRLVHDAVLGAYLGEMIDYTPGAHLLIFLVARWLRTDALHVVHGVVSATVALKAGILFLIARRLTPYAVPRVAFALLAPLMLWMPYTFFTGSFMEQSFLSQAVSELFAIAMWWTLVVWDDRPSRGMAALFALFAVAAFLTWPVWVGPLVLMFAALLLIHRELTWIQKARCAAIALAPLAAIVLVYASGRLVYGFRMVNAVGYAVWPTPRTLGVWFAITGILGVLQSFIGKRMRTVALLFLAIVLQGVALIATGLNSGATAPYLSLKMSYLVIYPLAVAAASLVGESWRALRPSWGRFAWLVVLVVVFEAARIAATAPVPRPVVTQPVFLAGEWARTHLPNACVDYLVADGYTGYWLHLAVLGNPRAAGRALETDTFEPQKAIVRWILPDGLPYAIAGDFDALPRDIRTSVDVLARFGPAAVVGRRGPSSCK